MYEQIIPEYSIFSDDAIEVAHAIHNAFRPINHERGCLWQAEREVMRMSMSNGDGRTAKPQQEENEND